MTKKIQRIPEYDRLVELLTKVTTLDSVSELLNWDEEVMMPKGETMLRGKQKGVLSGISHDMFVSDEVGALLGKLSKERLSFDQRAVVRVTQRDYDSEKKVPTSLVEALERAETEGYAAWESARKNDDFKSFVPALSKVIELTKQRAGLIDPNANPYAVLFNDYEPDMPLSQMQYLLRKVTATTVPLVKSIIGRPQPDSSFLQKKVSIEKQRKFNRYIAKAVGFDFHKGRLDEAPHPFSSGWRIITRYSDTWDLNIGSTIHEAGHGMYEQNLSSRHFGTPLGASASFSVHESQSRIWELNVGLRRPFWTGQYHKLQESYAPVLDDVSLDDFLKAINKVEPSAIRLTADEVSYPLHIALRFELEDSLINGRLKTEEIPDAWNAKMQEYFGITPANNKEGCLQDVHWSQGLFGYFPTYVLGSAMAAQLYAGAKREWPFTESYMFSGNCRPLRQWLTKKIHSQGQRYPTTVLIERASGKEFSTDDYLDHLEQKCYETYGVKLSE